MIARSLCFSLIAAGCGAFAWSTDHPWLMLLSLGFPILLGLTRDRVEAGLVAASYFAAALAPSILSTKVFFPDHSWVTASLLYAGAVGVAALCFAWAGERRAYRPAYLFGTLVVHGISPFGLASPICTAGLLFPGCGLIGSALTLAVCYFAMESRRRYDWVLAMLIVVSFFINVRYVPPRAVPGWSSYDTRWGAPVATEDWARLSGIFSAAEHSANKVSIFPEGLISNYSDSAADEFFRSSVDILAAQGKTVIFGANTPAGRDEWQNRMIVRGALSSSYRQRVPIPLAMWGNGYAASVYSKSSVQVGGRRAAVLLCYEQLLPIAAIESISEHPDVIVAPSDLYWAPESVENAERACARSWARLAGVPLLQAVNR